jgi:hypothetical protein
MLRRLLVLSIVLTASLPDPSALAQTTPADRLKAIEATYPPWQHGDSSDVGDRGLEFTVPPADALADFHGSLDNHSSCCSHQAITSLPWA